jgi:hypothetical protein
MTTAVLSAPLLGGRVLELYREPHGRAWRLAVTQVDGLARRRLAASTGWRIRARGSAMPKEPTSPRDEPVAE